jgi:hypothetical protein
MRVLGPDLPSCAPPGTPPEALLQQLLALALHLLSPNLPDTLSRPGAPLALQLLRSYPAAARSFLPALVTKVASPGSSPVLIAELLVVVTVLARADAGQLVNMLANLTCSLPGGLLGVGGPPLLDCMHSRLSDDIMNACCTPPPLVLNPHIHRQEQSTTSFLLPSCLDKVGRERQQQRPVGAAAAAASPMRTGCLA